MKFKFDQKETTDIPIAFIDDEGDLWFRTTDEENLMDNIVYIICRKTNTVLTYCDMEDFIECSDTNVDDNHQGNYAMKTFFKGDSITITF